MAKVLEMLRGGVVALAMMSFAVPGWADGIPAATGEPILIVDGLISPEAPEGGYALDLAALEQLPKVEFTTSTIWTDSTISFVGVPLKAVLDAAGATGTIVAAEALNGYVVEIPVADLEEKAPILAYFADGKELSRRDKGPLWIVYPYDSDEKYKSEIAYAYSVWQLAKLTIK